MSVGIAPVGEHDIPTFLSQPSPVEIERIEADMERVKQQIQQESIVFLNGKATREAESSHAGNAMLREKIADHEVYGNDERLPRIGRLSRAPVANKPGYREARKRLFQELQAGEEEARSFVLVAIWRAQQVERKQREQAKTTQKYRQERKRVGRLLEKLAANLIVSSAPDIDDLGL